MCSCSPRDYTAMAACRQQARDRHNHQPRVVEEGGAGGEGGRERTEERKIGKERKENRMEGGKNGKCEGQRERRRK